MISRDALEKLGRHYHMGVFPNIVREYFQHMFLGELYTVSNAEKLLFKGGTALRIVYGSPRYSEDLDFSLYGVSHAEIKEFVEKLFIHVLAEMARADIQVELGDKIGTTSGGYFGVATFRMFEYPSVAVELNISAREGRSGTGEVDSVTNDFVPTYTIIHVPQTEIVEEKIFDALMKRKKPRDFYDLYFIMRKNMLSSEQKIHLADVKGSIIADAREINFKGELGAFLPSDQHAIIKDFPEMLTRELERQIGSR